MNQYNEEYLIMTIEKVLFRLINLENQAFGKEADPWKGFANRDFGIETWDWPQGVGLYGMEQLQNYYGDARYDSFFEEWLNNNRSKGFPSANINTTAPYNMLLALEQRTKNKQYKKMCLERAQWLVNELPKTAEGGFWHVTTDLFDKNGVILNENQLWIDTLFMAVLFLAKAGVTYKKKAWIDESINQILIHIKYLYDKQARLLHHGWSFDRNDNFGGIFWARGNSWFTYGILQLLAILEDYLPEGLKVYLRNTFCTQLNELVHLQAESGLLLTVLTDVKSYQEVSGSALFTAGLFKAMRMKILDESYLGFADKALKAVIENIDQDGTILNVSAGTAIGLNAQHYQDIIIAPMPYGQAMVILALIEALEFLAKRKL